jgi:RNA recognition motif-containing protein
MNIYVSNLSFNVQDEDLKEFFAEYGEVSSAKIIMDKFTNKSRGFGFVEMPDDEAGQKAIKETIAKPREERTGGGGGNRGGGDKRSFSGSNNRW